MITIANENQTDEIKALWRTCFPEEDPKYTEYYFRSIYQPEDCFVYLDNNRITACIMRNKHAVMYNSRALQMSMLNRAATLPEYRHHGYMRALLNAVIDACEHSELLTMTQTADVEHFQNFGFRTLYYRTEYVLKREDCKRTTNFGCSFNPTAIDLLKVYSFFISRFNGFYARDLQYFAKKINENRAKGGKVVAYFNGKDQIQGYAFMVPAGQEMIMDELVYLDSTALMKLINMGLQEKKTVRVYVSEAEDLSKVFPQAEQTTYSSTMVRLNDAELFTKLFGKRINTVEDILDLSRKPLTLNETV